LLPNYTLLDDTVDLAVSVRWRDPETDSFEHDEFEISRGAAQALRDFAPGSTFYAHGFAIGIDAVDLGADGEEVHTWACCAGCGYAVDLTAASDSGGTGAAPASATGAAPPGQCPRCGSATIGDVGQQLPVVELRSVSSVIRREEAAIDDATDERIRRSFRIIIAADVDPGEMTKRWFVDPLGLGATHLRGVHLRWLNLGIAGGGGSTRIIAGQKVDSALFRVCSECGKLDRSTGANRPSEHRPWCSLRNV